ncbi:MAG: TSUP family transporter [Oscillospiraceae bacterium]
MTEAVVGFLTGAAASMGLGGGFILMIWLTAFAGVAQREAQGINVLFFLPIALISVIIHLRGGLINKQLVFKCAVGGAIGAALGSFGSAALGNSLLQKLWALFLLGFGLRELLAKPKRRGEETR